MFGQNIKSRDDRLVKVPVEKIWNALRNPKPATLEKIRQVRQVRTMNQQRYTELKTQLPYIVCGHFTPPYRIGDNFSFTEYFMLDIDHISDKELSVEGLKQRFMKDPRVVLCFVSPSENGLKLLFKLSERCTDKGLYSLFYKNFAKNFARQYNIEQVVDNKTSDVTRACFVSYDPDAYYNPDAEPIELKGCVPHDDPTAMLDLKRELEKEEHSIKKDIENHGPSEPTDEQMRKIKSLIGPKVNRQQEKLVYVPEQLNEIMDDLRKYITDMGIVINEVKNISYGKKIRTSIGLKQAEVNLFYGKRGFSVVKSPRTGTDEEFNDLMVGVLQAFIIEKL